MNIPDKAVDVVAESMFHATTPHYWPKQSAATKMLWWARANTALEAAAPFIAAQALRGAAEELHTEPYENFTHRPHTIECLREAALVSGGIDSAAVWLESRADGLEAGK